MSSREQLGFLRAFPSRTAQRSPLKQINQAQRDGVSQALCRKDNLAESYLGLTPAFEPGTFTSSAAHVFTTRSGCR